MINGFLLPKVQDIGVSDLWFQQDGATCHTAGETIDLLKKNFHEQIISRNGPVNWPPRSCDLTLLDYFLWGYVKSLVYFDKLKSIDALEANITRVINRIPADMFETVLENWTYRMDHVRASCGQFFIIKLIFMCFIFKKLPEALIGSPFIYDLYNFSRT